jgi:hypothetical protein
VEYQGLSGGPIAAGEDEDGMLHRVAQGECVSSIAEDAGFLWETVWNHPTNSLLKSRRKDPNILLPGDVLFIPRRTVNEFSRATDMTHCFRLKREPCMLRLQVLDNDEIQANATYMLLVEGKVYQGITDSDGKLEHRIPANARAAKLVVGPHRQEYLLDLGELDPITEMTGVQGRLRNLDYYAGELDGQLNDETRQALKEFQLRQKLPTTGEPNQATREKLQEIHGS